MRFPDGFRWGVATSAYQIEGATRADGRGESVWDRFCRTPGKIADGSSGDVACEHYARYPEDLALMSSLGIQTYRFSISWPRIVPSGAGEVNKAGLDFYRRLVDGLLERGIRPMATLYHWDLPQALQDQGGWASRDTAGRFADYAATVMEALGDRVDCWITHNEPFVVAYLGHAWGTHAPGLTDWAAAVRVAHHLLLSHGLAVQAFRSVSPARGDVGIALDLSPVYPGSAGPEDEAAARWLDGFRNRWFLDAVLRGDYPADMAQEYESRLGPLDWIRPGDAKLIGAAIDFLGVNFYTRTRVKTGPGSDFLGFESLPPQGPVTAMGWEVAADALFDLLMRLKADYGDLPLHTTENGAAFNDAPDGREPVEDPERVAYLRDHIAAVGRAIAAGVNLRGYCVWSLLDNFEWQQGYSKRFGLVYVDYRTQRRILKRSALWYRDLIARDGLLDEDGRH